MNNIRTEKLSKNTFNYIKEESLPIVALRGMVIFPGIVTHLDIGRIKSIEALNQSMENNKKIFLVAQKNPLCDNPNKEDIYQIGVIASIKQIIKLPTGIVRVLIQGEKRGCIKSFYDKNNYIEANIEIINYFYINKDFKTKALIRLLIREFIEYVEMNSEINQEIIVKIKNVDDLELILNLICNQLLIEFREKQKLLEENIFNKKIKSILNLLITEKKIIKFEQEISEKVKNNINKSQKEYYLKEQLKVIRKELNESIDYEEEIDKLRERLKPENYSKKIFNKIKKEINKLEGMSFNTAESPVLRTYIEWLLDLPWEKKTKEAIDLKKVKKILDKGHFGLEKAKERIIEHLAVKKLTKNSSNKSPILCFVGPPGVGKTSLASSIGEAINRNFARMSLGGIKDEAEIRGHRRTYVGAMPGRIIKSIKEAGTKNPIILLDEIDKLGSDYKGDPSSALLEALDPEQNYMFSDHYIEFPFDLSDVFFITTANNLNNIPNPLKDRMEIIFLSSYTDEEKLEIAKKYLFKKQLKENGLIDYNIIIEDDALVTIIKDYTKEAGVRNLERQIKLLLRKIAVNILEGKILNLIIKKNSIQEYMGIPKINNYKSKRSSEIGVVNGLAVSNLGGDLLTIEGTKYSGKGKLSLTGQLGDVMKESVEAAISYLRSIGTIKDSLESLNLDLHIHVPEGATPKDGPSAGVAMIVVLASLFTESIINKDIAMTGEVTIRGHILPIGAVKEKVLAAYNNAIKKIYLPIGNKKDLEDIPKEVKNSLEIVLVNHVSQVLEGVFINEN